MEKRLLKSPSKIFKSLKETSWGTIIVSKDNQIDHCLESMPAGAESCPYWYSVRVFQGTETSPGVNKKPEYWLGICNVFLAPIIPIPIIGDEIVVKLGESLDGYNQLKSSLGAHFAHKIMMDKTKYFKKIINKATVKFIESDINYNNDEIWSAY
jgi:hypothetical protein